MSTASRTQAWGSSSILLSRNPLEKKPLRNPIEKKKFSYYCNEQDFHSLPNYRWRRRTRELGIGNKDRVSQELIFLFIGVFELIHLFIHRDKRLRQNMTLT